MARCYSNLSTVHYDQGDLEHAKGYTERALTICLKKLDPDQLDVVTCYNNLVLFTKIWVSWSRPKSIMNVHLAFV